MIFPTTSVSTECLRMHITKRPTKILFKRAVQMVSIKKRQQITGVLYEILKD